MIRIVAAALGGAAVAYLASPALNLPMLAYWNTSPSVPLGAWLWSSKWPPERGDVVAMRDPPMWPHDVLLKRVEGVAGDRFCWSEQEGRHYINDRPMPVLSPLAYDLEALVPEFSIWRGCRVLEPGEIAGFGEGSLSHGSAYLGPVWIDDLHGVYWRLEMTITGG